MFVAHSCTLAQNRRAWSDDSAYGWAVRATVQYSTVQYSTVQYSTVQYSTVQYMYMRTSISWTHHLETSRKAYDLLIAVRSCLESRYWLMMAWLMYG